MINRKYRRELEKKGYSLGAITKIAQDNGYDLGYEDGYKKGQSQATEIMIYMTMYTLEYKLELENDDLLELIKSIIGNVESYATGHLAPEDYDTIKKEMNKLGFYY